MVTQAKLSWKGFEDYLEALVEAGEEVEVIAKEGIGEALKTVQTDMQNLVPIDTGNLYNHIQVDGPHQEGNVIYGEVGVIHDIKFTDKDTAIYGNVIEYGSSSVAAQPYIRPAISKNRNILKKVMKKIAERFGLK